MSSRKLDVIRHFDDLPSSAVVHVDVVVAVTGLSDRCVRRTFQRVYISKDRYGVRVSEVRDRLANGVPAAERRLRVGPDGTRLIGTVQAAASKAEAEKLIEQFDSSKMSADERGRLHTLLERELRERQGDDWKPVGDAARAVADRLDQPEGK
jgi:hypothetical protein